MPWKKASVVKLFFAAFKKILLPTKSKFIFTAASKFTHCLTRCVGVWKAECKPHEAETWQTAHSSSNNLKIHVRGAHTPSF